MPLAYTGYDWAVLALYVALLALAAWWSSRRNPDKADDYFLAGHHEVDAAHGFVVLAHVVVALGAAGMVVEGHARADDVDEGRAAMRHRGVVGRLRDRVSHRPGGRAENDAREPPHGRPNRGIDTDVLSTGQRVDPPGADTVSTTRIIISSFSDASASGDGNSVAPSLSSSCTL
mgnify:CR=1 FL=1